MNAATIIALACVAGFILFLIGLSLFRRSLADVTIQVYTNPRNGGDRIEGALKIRAKRNLVWEKVTVALRCLDRADRGEHSNPHYEIFRDEQTLCSASELAAGESQQFSFTFEVPLSISPKGASIRLPEVVQRTLEPLKEAALRRRARDIRWELAGTVELGSLSLDRSKRLNIDVMP